LTPLRAVLAQRSSAGRTAVRLCLLDATSSRGHIAGRRMAIADRTSSRASPAPSDPGSLYLGPPIGPKRRPRRRCPGGPLPDGKRPHGAPRLTHVSSPWSATEKPTPPRLAAVRIRYSAWSHRSHAQTHTAGVMRLHGGVSSMRAPIWPGVIVGTPALFLLPAIRRPLARTLRTGRVVNIERLIHPSHERRKDHRWPLAASAWSIEWTRRMTST
jgi:hypothetical protein